MSATESATAPLPASIAEPDLVSRLCRPLGVEIWAALPPGALSDGTYGTATSLAPSST